MMKNISKYIGVLCLTGLSVACAPKTNKNYSAPAIDFTAIDSAVNPTEDFYHFVNGQWLKNNPLPAAYSRYGSFDILGDSSTAQVHAIVEELAKGKYDKGTNEYRIATLYNQAMDSVTRNKLGAEPIKADLKAIQNIKTKAELVSYAAKQDQEYGAGVLFGSYVAADDKNSTMNILHLSQAGLALGPRDYYLENDESMKQIRTAYAKYLVDLAQLSGYSKEDAERISKNTLKIETELAKICYSQVELRDANHNYNITNIAEFAKAHKGFDWNAYFSQRGLKVATANFGQLEFFKKFDSWFATVSLDELKDKLTAEMLNSSANALGDKFVALNFDFYGRTISGKKEMKPRWERSVAVVDEVLGEAIGQEYVKKYFSPEAKERMLTLVSNLQKALAKRVEGLEWMSKDTKAKALAKLNSFTVKIGYPDKWKDYSSLDIDASKTYYENLKAASRFRQADNLKDLGKPVDRTKWLMNPQEVNAYYMPTTNEICFPAGILQPPFFNMNADDAVNYGAIGVVIGHEMTHGFDDQGSQFDKDGNMNNWWTAEDAAKFSATTKRLAAQFSENIVAPGVHANGDLTLGENIADQGGLSVAFEAMKLAIGNKQDKIDNLTPAQRFFIAYARLWGQNITEQEILRRTKTDPHSLGDLRVNQALKNVTAFHEAFSTKPGDKMYLAPEKRIVVW